MTSTLSTQHSAVSTELAERGAVIAEARSWLRTPYHHLAALKGAGVDCAMLLLRCYQAAGKVPAELDPRPYPVQWHLHRGEERYLGWVRQYGTEVETPSPGDLVLYRVGRCFSHGAIVVDWPRIIHAWHASRCCELGEGDGGDLADRPRVFFTLWPPHSSLLTPHSAKQEAS